MTKKITAIAFSITLMSAYPLYAMNCHDTSDDVHSTTMRDHMGEGINHHMDQIGTEMNHNLNEQTVRDSVKKYMSGKGMSAYHIASMEDNGTHYIADIHSHSGDLLDKLYINKKTGSINSLLEE